MRSRDVAYVVHVEAEQRPHLRLFQQLLDARKTLGAQPLKIYPFFPVYAHQTIGSDRHDFSPSFAFQGGGQGWVPGPIRLQFFYTRPHNVLATSTTEAAVGTVRSSSTGENGTGTSIAPRRLTGASR